MRTTNKELRQTNSGDTASRKGIISVLSAVVLVALFAFVAFAVDTGLMVLTQTEMADLI